MVGISPVEKTGKNFSKTMDLLEERYAFLLRDAEII
jgi:hypothetical protein